ncbi:ras-interacting 1 [Labeo rohita]|uniref:Ras-interacting 1 n=1 Tax=Labeo rohita TaxID=84645 RepID=A0A498NE82_LABRO|nr:ras-interacting 1 [Labeo rohita]
MEESGSPRFRKLHFPVGLWINSPRKHFAKLGARWPSAASVKSTTSSDAASLPEAPSSVPSSLSHSTPSLAPPSPSPSPAFLRPRPANQQSRAKRLSHLFLRGRSNSDRDRAIGEREREIWAHSATPSSHHYLPPASSNAPGLVKIYGDALSSGANYRSLLANMHSTARQLIQQVITRYTERERENENEDTALARAFRGGPVTLNGAPLYREAVLKPGDLLGLGSHFLFLYRDPRVTPAPPLALPPPWQGDMSTSYSPGGMTDRQEMLRQYLGSTESLLRFQAKHADALLQDKIKEFGDKHPTQNSAEADVELPPPSVQKLSSDLRPLMFWMSNATELLNFFQVKVETMEKEWEFEAPGDPVLSADMDTCSEALAQLDDVIMHTFQQCVYHLTKTLYSLLPALLDTNPFSSEEKKKGKAGAKDRAGNEGEGDEEEDGSTLPPTVAGLVEVYRCSLQLSREACLSPPLTSQTFGYLFFFTNTSLLNTLLERDSLFSWSRAVQIRTNLDLVLDWLQGAGLGDIASEFLKKLSVTVNFLCIPKTRLIQSSWSSLQEEHPLLNPSQLHHLLTHYKLGPTRAPPSSWAPPLGTELGGVTLKVYARGDSLPGCNDKFQFAFPGSLRSGLGFRGLVQNAHHTPAPCSTPLAIPPHLSSTLPSSPRLSSARGPGSGGGVSGAAAWGCVPTDLLFLSCFCSVLRHRVD